MASFKAGIPFALTLKLCGPEHDHSPEPVRDAGAPVIIDAGVAVDAASAANDAALAPGDAGAFASDAATLPDAGPPEILSGPPGLYADEACERLAQGVRPYAPRFALWSDGADKERFVFLPAGAAIDASDPDVWRFPIGARFYKTFSQDGLKLETRIIEKVAAASGPDAWTFRSYAWLADQSGVQLAEAAGRANVLGAAGQDAINGFGAIQLNHAQAGVTLASLLEQGSLTSPLADDLLDLAVVPGDDRARNALGYMHANCGNCHGGPTPRGQMTLRLSVGQLEVESTSAYASAVAQPLRVWTGRTQVNGFPIDLRIAPTAPTASGVILRMSDRGSRDQMPPIASEVVDTEGVAAVSAWVESL